MKYILLSFIMATVLYSCSDKKCNYHIVGSITDKKAVDSAYLYVYESNYKKLRLLNSAKIYKSSLFRFEGICNTEQIAFVRLKGDSVPYYFILNNNDINISINKKGYILRGDAENNKYFHYLLKQQNIINAKKALWDTYTKLASDSLLNDSLEQLLKKKNDYLIDSLNSMKRHFVEKKTTSSQLVLHQFGNQPIK